MVSFRVDEDDLARLDALALQTSCSRAKVLRYCIRRARLKSTVDVQPLTEFSRVHADCHSGILYRAMGIPTVMFAIGCIPGWIAHWKEMLGDPDLRIGRPRQIYMGAKRRDYVSMEARQPNRP